MKLLVTRFNNFIAYSCWIVPMYFYVWIPLFLERSTIPNTLILLSTIFTFTWVWMVKWKKYREKDYKITRFVVDLSVTVLGLAFIYSIAYCTWEIDVSKYDDPYLLFYLTIIPGSMSAKRIRTKVNKQSRAVNCMLDGIRLIEQDEDAASYLEQTYLIRQFSVNQTADSLLRLALLLDFPPIGDYETAIVLLERIWSRLKDVRAILISAYIELTESGSISTRNRTLLLNFPSDEDNKLRAVGKYILAREAMMQENRTQAISHLKKSIELYVNTVLPYCNLAALCPDSREKLLQKAHQNIKRYVQISDLEEISKAELINPDRVINELLGIEMNEVLYDEFFLDFKR